MDALMSSYLRALAFLLVAATAQAAPYPEPVHGEFVIRDFRFAGGEVLPELTLHYFTLGTPARDADGRVTNAVLLLHGTYGKGTNFLTEGSSSMPSATIRSGTAATTRSSRRGW